MLAGLHMHAAHKACKTARQLRDTTLQAMVKKMKKKTKDVPVLRKGATEQEMIDWATTHDPFDRIEDGTSALVEDHSDLDELLLDALFQENKAQLNMRIPPAMKALLTKLARERTTDATTLGRIWLAERIRKELSSK